MKKNNKETKHKIMTEEDFIYCPRLGNSLKNLIEKNPEGVDDDRIARVLLMKKEEVEKTFMKAIEKLRQKIGIH